MRIRKTTIWMGISLVLFIVLAFTLTKDGGITGATVGIDTAVEDTIDFINTNLLESGTTAELISSEEKYGLYTFKMEIDGQEYESYVTPDGNMLFTMPGVDMTQEVPTQQQAPPSEMVKSDKPVVELFVMSHCPYGTQIEKGIIPVVELLGDKIDFELKFCDYAMHMEKELNEQLLQYCIQKETNEIIDYLKCFLQDDDSGRCVEELDIDVTKCISVTDEEFKVSENFADQSTYKGRFPSFNVYLEDNQKYDVQGSPVLVINGAQVQSGRDSASLLTTICAAFNTAPEECDEVLSSAQPSPGFGFSETGAATDASCS